MTIAEKIQRELGKWNMTIQDVGRKVETSTTSLYHCASGTNKPRWETLCDFALAFDMTLSELLEGVTM